MIDVYSAGRAVHSTVESSGGDSAVSWWDDDGNAYTLQPGDRIIIEEILTNADANNTPNEFTIYFDYAGSGSFVGNSGEEVLTGNMAAGESVVFPHGSPRAGKRKMKSTVPLRINVPSGQLYFSITARIIQT